MFARFPTEEYYRTQEKGKAVNVTHAFLNAMPDELIEFKEFFWDNHGILKPINRMNFEFSNGVRNYKNYWKHEIVEGYVAENGQGWVKINHNLEGGFRWWTFEEVTTNQELYVQLVYKVMYEGWIYVDKYWWRIVEFEAVLDTDEIVDLTADSDMEEEIVIAEEVQIVL